MCTSLNSHCRNSVRKFCEINQLVLFIKFKHFLQFLPITLKMQKLNIFQYFYFQHRYNWIFFLTFLKFYELIFGFCEIIGFTYFVTFFNLIFTNFQFFVNCISIFPYSSFTKNGQIYHTQYLLFGGKNFRNILKIKFRKWFNFTRWKYLRKISF